MKKIATFDYFDNSSIYITTDWATPTKEELRPARVQIATAFAVFASIALAVTGAVHFLVENSDTVLTAVIAGGCAAFLMLHTYSRVMHSVRGPESSLELLAEGLANARYVFDASELEGTQLAEYANQPAALYADLSDALERDGSYNHTASALEALAELQDSKCDLVTYREIRDQMFQQLAEPLAESRAHRLASEGFRVRELARIATASAQH